MEDESKVGACSVRSNKVMQSILKGVCKRLQLDMASVLKLSLYLFSLHYGCTAVTDKSLTVPHHRSQIQPTTGDYLAHEELIQLINELELLGKNAGLPSFEEFSTGKKST